MPTVQSTTAPGTASPFTIVKCEQNHDPNVEDTTTRQSGMTHVVLSNSSDRPLSGVAILVNDGSYASTREALTTVAPGATVDLVLSDPTLPFYHGSSLTCAPFAARFVDGATWESQTSASNAFLSTTATSMSLAAAGSSFNSAHGALRPPTIRLATYCGEWDELNRMRSGATEAQIEANYSQFDQVERRVAAGYYHCYQRLEGKRGTQEAYARGKLLLLYLQTLKSTLVATSDARQGAWITTLGTQLAEQSSFADIVSDTKTLLSTIPQSASTSSSGPGVAPQGIAINVQQCQSADFASALSAWDSDFATYADDADSVRQMLSLKATLFNKVAYAAAIATEATALHHAQGDEGALQQALYVIEQSHATETAKAYARVLADVQTADSYAASYTAGNNLSRDDATNVKAARISVTTDSTQINPDTSCKS
jgi:hypothetical protein